MSLAYSNVVKPPPQASPLSSNFSISPDALGNMRNRLGISGVSGVSTTPSSLPNAQTSANISKYAGISPEAAKVAGINPQYIQGGAESEPTSILPSVLSGNSGKTTTPSSGYVNPSTVGTYKGVAITPGDSASVASQIAKIDAPPQVATAQPLAVANIPSNGVPGGAAATGAGTAGTPPTYPGLVRNLATVGQNGSTAATNASAGLAATAATNPGTSGPAYQDYQAAVQKQNALKQQEAQVLGSTASQPIPLVFQQGRAQVLQNQFALQNDAAAQAVTQAQQGIGYQLQGTTAQQSGLNQSGTLALNNQGQQISALGTAAGLAAPQVTGYGQTSFNPVDNSFGASGGGNLDPQTQASQLAKDVISGKMTYDQAAQSLGYAGSVGSNFLNSAITAAGGNPLQLQATGQTQQGIIGTQGQQIATYQSALQQGQNLQAQLSDLITSFGLNPSDLNAANQAIQKIAQNTSSPQYKILQNYVNDVANTYSQVLTPPGGSATDTTRGIASSMLDATANGQSILSVMQSLDAAAKAKIAGVSTTGAYSNSGQTSQGNQGSGSSHSSLNDASAWPGFN